MRQMDEAGLRGAIGRHPTDRPEPQYRGDVDDAAGALALDEVMRKVARRQPRAFQVRVDDMIPIRFAVLEQRFRHDNPGIVDEDRQRPKPVFRIRDGLADAVLLGDIAGER